MKCDRTTQTFCPQMKDLLAHSDTVKLASQINLRDPEAGPRVWIRNEPGENSFYFINVCPFCAGDWGYKGKHK